jgi:hypothetical protein
MRSVIVAIGLLTALFEPAAADYLLNCRLMDPGHPLYRQHCKEASQVVRLECASEEDCVKTLGDSTSASGTVVENAGSAVGAEGVAGSSAVGGNCLRNRKRALRWESAVFCVVVSRP